jgi:hypothetical protein
VKHLCEEVPLETLTCSLSPGVELRNQGPHVSSLFERNIHLLDYFYCATFKLFHVYNLNGLRCRRRYRFYLQNIIKINLFFRKLFTLRTAFVKGLEYDRQYH